MIGKEVTPFLPVEPVNKLGNRNSSIVLFLEAFCFVYCVAILVIGFASVFVTLRNILLIAFQTVDNDTYLRQKGKFSMHENSLHLRNIEPKSFKIFLKMEQEILNSSATSVMVSHVLVCGDVTNG
jgi:hypothetical protein